MEFKKSQIPFPAFLTVVLLMAFISSCSPQPDSSNSSTKPDRLNVLFIGDDQGHEPTVRLRDVARPMLDRGIELFYSGDLIDMNLENLRKYDAVLLYANYHEPHYPETDPKLIEDLLTYVREGGGFVPIHSASGNFRESEDYIALLGAAFESHGTDTVRTRIAEPEHEIMEGFNGFESWDETYVHKAHNKENRTVLSFRDNEPWTWIRTEGEGRVFYTAWGHDERTWQNPGFHDLLERGIRWAGGQDVQMELASRKIENPFEYVVLDVPFPPPHEERLRYEEEVGPMDRESNNPRYYRKQKAVDPEVAIDRMIVQPGYRVELFASEPDIVNPIYSDWDEQGRLWVIESMEYPYPRSFWPNGGGKDKIKILEDTDGDGKADKFTTFADSLNIPTSLTFSNGGLIVHQAPQTLFLKDTNGDDRADVREVLFEGWNQWDTHAGPNNLHYGLDNWIWGVLGYAGMEGIIGGEKHEFRMGVYRFLSDGTKLEYLQRTNNNTWGLGFNEQGNAFISTANGNPTTLHTVPQRYYRNYDRMVDSVTDRLTSIGRVITLTNLFRQVDFVGGFTSAAGHGFYNARTWPESYWNRRAFITEPTVQLIAEMSYEESGSGYTADYQRNLIASDDEWFSPVHAEVGPDGHVWVTDWYNYVLQHNAESDRQEPTPGNAYANPLRDRQHGRIYRIVHEQSENEESVNLKNADSHKLVETLSHNNMGWRMHAQRLLVERGQTDIVPELIELISDQSVDNVGLNAPAIHSMWTLHGLGQLAGSNDEALEGVIDALDHPSAGVRMNAIQVLPATSESVTAILDANLMGDESQHVVLKSLLSLADMPASQQAGEQIFQNLSGSGNLDDQWIREATLISGSVHNDGFLAEANRAGYKPGDMQADEDDPAGSLESIIATISRDATETGVGNTSQTEEIEVDAVLELSVTPNVLEFDQKELRAEAGQTIQVIFTNTDNMEHNLLFIQPGTLADVGELADQMVTSPDGRSRGYVPNTSDVIASTPILNPGESYELIFTVPDEPGDYQFVCTIPGHWRNMNGILKVVNQ